MTDRQLADDAYWFGNESVSPTEKTSRVRGVFDRVARRYDLMNDLMSAGVHRLWKDHFIRAVRPSADRHLLDLAGGTGDIAFRWVKRAGPGARVTVCDLNHDMVSVGRDRGLDRGIVGEVDWVVGNAEALPFPDRAVDVVTIAFGLRNVTRIDVALAEAHRVLKPGGRFWCLEFSRVRNPVLRAAYERYSDIVIPRLGAAVAQDRESYRYLVDSIRRFPDQAALIRRIAAAGFGKVRVEDLSGGIAAIHSAWRI